MLVVFPIGLFVFSFICDLGSLAAPDAQPWMSAALYTMVGGFVGGLAAAVPGAIDLLSIRELRVRKIGLLHMALNLVAVTLYGVNLWLRFRADGNNQGLPLVLSLISVAMLGISGWLGGELVFRNGVGVDTGNTEPISRNYRL